MASGHRPPDSSSGPHVERTTGKFTTTIKDENGTPIPAANIQTLTLTLYNEATLSIINSRDGQNILNANNVTVDANGLLTWSIQALDRVIEDDTQKTEKHRALFQWTANAGAVVGKHEHRFEVANLAKVP